MGYSLVQTDSTITKVFKQYKNLLFKIGKNKGLEEEEIENIGLYSTWTALRDFNEDKGLFINFLYSIHLRECQKYSRLKYPEHYRKHLHKRKLENNSIEYVESEYNIVEDIISVLPERDAGIIKCKILYNMTYKEIGQKYSVSTQWAERLYKKAIRKLKYDSARIGLYR